MTTVEIETWIRGREEDCFDAARDLDLHVTSLAHTKEKAIGGRTAGLIESGEEVTWRGRHFGVQQTFTSKITAFDRPHHFQDTMQRGAFRSFVHDHYFTALRDGTAMKDVVTFAAPLGILGKLVERVVLRGYLARLLTARAEAIKHAVESRRRNA